MTLYLKYRPQKISELDLAGIRELLGKMLAGNIPHAWLFSGPRGTGKTSSARILAKSINCPKQKGIEPCNECEMCQEITSGAAVDVAEIDAASNRGIDEIRELREKVKLAPMRAKYKVYIIDEVHMLTTEAANALLKTLEEPPERTVFILCTTEPERLPETVVSRCTRVIFRKPSEDEAVASLKRVAEGEKVKTDARGLALIAKAARGSFRDGTKILEQVITDKGNLSEEAVRGTLGMMESADPVVFLQLWNEGQTDEALKFIDNLGQQGVNFRSFVERCVEEVREEMLKNISKGVTGYIEKIKKLSEVYEQIKSSAVAQLPLEVMVLEKGDNKDTKTEKKEVEISGTPLQFPPSLGGKVKGGIEEFKQEKIVIERPEGKGKYGLEDVTGKWTDIMKAVKPKNHSVEALLRSTRPMEFDGQRLILEVFYKFHKDKLETEKCRQIVEEAVGGAFGITGVKLHLKLGDKPVGGKVEDNSEELMKAAAEIFKA